MVDDLMQICWTVVLLLCIIMLGQRGPFFCCACAYDGKVPFRFLQPQNIHIRLRRKLNEKIRFALCDSTCPT